MARTRSRNATVYYTEKQARAALYILGHVIKNVPRGGCVKVKRAIMKVKAASLEGAGADEKQ